MALSLLPARRRVGDEDAFGLRFLAVGARAVPITSHLAPSTSQAILLFRSQGNG